ncbi:MAG: polysaccharide biosynthesis C-terminal domain-containing protein, partial [Betaproteobacteria bacterium]
LPSHLWNDARVRGLLLLTSMLVVVRAADSALVNLMRAKERSVAFNLYAVIKRYGSLAVILLTVTFFVPGISGFYVGTIVMEVLAVSVLYFYVRRTCEFRPSQFSWPLYKSMLAFGIPMIASELGGVVLNLSDRFVLQHFLGPEALGLYSAAYNLCDYVQTILIVSMGQAIVPMYVRIWREQGEAATRRFVQDSMHYYLLVGAAVVAGLAALQADLLVVLASEKYRDGAVIIPFAAAGMVINGGMTIFGAGLYIHKQTRTLAYLVAGCAVFNVSLNMVLVPRLGLLGAALCTLTSYSLLSALTFAASNKRLPLALPWRDIGKFCLLAFVMYLVVSHVHVGGASANLLAKVATGALVYALLVLAFDGRSRLVAAQFWRRQQDTP